MKLDFYLSMYRSICKSFPLKNPILVLLALSLFLCLRCANVYDNNKNILPIPIVAEDDQSIIPKQQTAEWTKDWWMARHEKCIKEILASEHRILFIGDSITEQWETTGIEYWNKMAKCNTLLNLGFSGDRTEHVLWRLINGELPIKKDYRYVVLNIGTNNSGQRNDTPESIAAGIGTIIELLYNNNPNAKIILLSLLPRGKDLIDIYRINNNKVNDIIKQYDGYLNVKYLDLNSYFIDEFGIENLDCYFPDDTLHLSKRGYEILFNRLCEYINTSSFDY